jgi:hypothetical protein
MIGTGEKVHNTSVVIDILYRIFLKWLIQGDCHGLADYRDQWRSLLNNSVNVRVS